MASFTTTILGYQDNGNSRSWELPGNTTVRPRLMTQKRKPLAPRGTVAENSLSFGLATVDSDGLPIQEKVGCSIVFKTPINMGATETDIDDLITYVRDFVASDELVTLVKNSRFVAAA